MCAEVAVLMLEDKGHDAQVIELIVDQGVSKCTPAVAGAQWSTEAQFKENHQHRHILVLTCG